MIKFRDFIRKKIGEIVGNSLIKRNFPDGSVEYGTHSSHLTQMVNGYDNKIDLIDKDIAFLKKHLTKTHIKKSKARRRVKK